ncbi:hypothetical protein GCM10011575_35090 [Microlunatus endophyticus]|uniref:Beta-lactamase-related domain-containing protein n=1 Tax=Microlunatus endophyticus TaxID=1716077 RepID=A0A917SE12_9ACTN|nr:serine hydrolase domain-containing protein [Microlunatus endophyticus]GGL73704.1 hypothetical protein GCM10011575_35090 [Microlunatus endophyticus]
MWQAAVAQLCEQGGIPGAVVAVGGGGEVADRAVYGVCDLGSGTPVTSKTAFGVASVSKSFTAAAIMQLAASGALSLDQPVKDHIPEIVDLPVLHGADVRVRDLLSHVAGLPPLATRFSVLSGGGDAQAPRRPDWVADAPARISSRAHLFEYWRSLREVEPLGVPGDVFSYSNEGYVLLGILVERLSGMRLADYVQTRIFAPLGMTRSAYNRSSYVAADAWAVYHTAQTGDPSASGCVRAPARYYEPLWHSAGGVHATADDLVRYLRLYESSGSEHGERVLSSDDAQQMLTPNTESTLPGVEYGAGFWVGYVDGERFVYHGGSGKGISAYVCLFPDSGRSCAVVANVSGARVEQMAATAMRGHFGVDISEVHKAWRARLPGGAVRPDYRGVFRSDEGVSLSINGDEVIVSGDPAQVTSADPSGLVIRSRRGDDFIGYPTAFKPGAAVTFGGRVLRNVG